MRRGFGLSLWIENEEAGRTKGEERAKPVDKIAVCQLTLGCFSA